MAEQNYKEKIRKLLTLSKSDNENEAKSALLKAKKLMARHKISELDLEDIKDKKVKEIETKFSCSKRREPWMVDLATVIGQNFCCQAYCSREWGKQTSTICFVGFEDDLETCTVIFGYAVSCVRDGIEKIKKNTDRYSREYQKRLCDGYGYGFSYGVEVAFNEQKESDETGWGLVMTIPKEVVEATKDYEEKDFDCIARKKSSRNSYLDGYKDGKKFDPGTKLTEEKEENLGIAAKC